MKLLSPSHLVTPIQYTIKKGQNFQESYVIKQLLHSNLINMRFYVAEYNNIASFNIVVLCSIKPHIDLVQVQ